MGVRYARLFCGTLLMNFFVLLFTGGRSTPVPSKQIVITDVMKNNTELCNNTNFLYDSDYVKPCASLPYPTVPWNLNMTYDINTPLCLGMYDTAYKICQYSSRLQINSTEAFNLGVEKFIPDKNQTPQQFCQSLQGFTPTYNKIESLWGALVERLLNSTVKCQFICFGFEDKFHPLCAWLAWNNHLNDTVNIDTTGLKPNHLTSNKLPTSQPNSETTDSKSTGLKILLKTKETQEHNTKQTSNDNGNAEDKSSSSGNIPSTNVNLDVQKPNPRVEANGKDKTQKTKNNTSPETQAPKASLSVSDKDVIDKKLNAESAKSVSNPQTSSINVTSENTKKYIDEDKIEEINKDKDQDIDDVRPTTLSENTQEHYDVNPEDDSAMDGNDDIEDTNQQSIDAGNQNENAQEPYEQKASTQRFPRLRSDDSHFFTYFTVVTLACIAGYIGYHNKQKILAIVLEGRRSRNSRSRRRPSTANYRKLDCTLEEAVTSQCNSNVTHVIY